ncbi:MAG: arylsulfatase [Fimbriimonadaceae bacterium]|nr:arylsulfatase [Fimbriimonadaceae bacterium]
MVSVIAALAVTALQVKPNIVYIMADDLGYGEVGCYGQTKIPTPNIDRLAAEGVKFTRSYAASPVCAPTRASLLTGKHQGHASVRGNKEQGGFGPNDKEGQFPLPQSETTIAEALKSGGYRTALVGKWGLGGPDPVEHPLAHGFDRFYGYLCQRRAHNYYPPYLWSDHRVDLLMGNRPYNAHQKIDAPLATAEEYEERFGGKDYAPERMMDACTAFIKSSKSRPFFLYYAPVLPHVALQAPREWVEKFPKEWDPAPYLGQSGYLPNLRPRATYAAMIAYLDHTVGEILKALEVSGTKDNTLVIFTSDNGATFNGGVDREFFESNGILRAGKMSLYEGGIRVPFVASWPGKIQPGTTSDHVSVCYDALATLCDVTGVRAPKNDGLSYAKALVGKSSAKRDYVYFEYPEAASMQAVIFGDLKAIKPNLKGNPDLIEVYDLSVDPGEKRNIASARPDVVRRALEVLKKEHVQNRDFPLPGVDAAK